ncbi:MAG: mechanosensitive ion channel family protein [Ruminococcus sp.]|nr:mechanosensitive ion channel family protein [Ruminococcus sp.]
MKRIEELWNKIKDAVIQNTPNLLSAVIIAVLGILITALIIHITRKALERRKVDPSLSAFVCRAVRIVLYVFTLLAALSSMGISITAIVAFFSAAAAAIALALKDRLNDIASGIVILFTKPFVTGDFIEFSHYKGFVQKIDIMHTDILTYDGTNVIIPNSVISNAEVNNHTAEPVVRVQVDVPIPYDADIKKVKAILFDVMKHTDLLVRDEKHRDSVQIEKYGDSALEFSVRCYCDFKDYWTVYYGLTEHIKEALDDNNVTIPFNQLDVHIAQ